MTPAELTELYETNLDEWRRVLAAKQAAGERALMKWR
jgi:hypothetical protein